MGGHRRTDERNRIGRAAADDAADAAAAYAADAAARSQERKEQISDIISLLESNT